MKTVAVLGARGSIGAPVVDELTRREVEVRGLSRSTSPSIDLATGEGLEAALAGVDVVIDASNAGPKPGPARSVLVEGGKRLLEAERQAGVGHHVCISIVGIEQVPLPYYEIKVEQEAVVRAGGVPFSIVRSTQFHTLLDDAFSAAARFRISPRPGAPQIQPVDPAEVATRIAEVATGKPLGAITTVAGPETRTAAELARAWSEADGRRLLPVPLPLPGRLGKALRGGALTAEAPEIRGTRSFSEWMAARDRRPSSAGS